MEDAKAQARVHSNGLVGIVVLQESRDGLLYSAGTLPANGVGVLHPLLVTLDLARSYADLEATNLGHRCDDRCGSWPTMQDH